MDNLKKVGSIISTVLVVMVALIAVFLMGSRLLGYQVYTVLSGSMEPAYSPGDLLYVQKVNVQDIKVGDPITFVLNDNLVVATHRVVEIDAANQHFYTKGDANETKDVEPVHYKNVLGVPRFAIPGLGYVSNWIQKPPGTYITIAGCAVLIILAFLPDMLGKKEKQEDEEKPDVFKGFFKED